MAKQEKEIERWVTVNGVRVPIFKDGSVGGPKALQDKIKKNNEKKALTKTQKAEAYWKDNERRLKEGVKTKYHGENHSKLSQHSDIQKIAEEHVEKIWNGGAKTQELYDKVEEWAKKNNVDPVKAKEAAFKAMSEKYADSLKLQKEGKDPLQNIKKESKQSKQIDKDITSATTHKELTDKLKSQGLELDSADNHTMSNSNSLNGEKVTMYDKDGNEYQGTYNKYRDGGREIVNIKKTKDSPKKIARDNEDIKEKQIKQNEAERDRLNGKKTSSKTIKETHDSQLIKNAKAGNISNPSKLFMPELKTLAVEFGIDPTGKSKEELANIIGSILKKRK